MLQLLGANCASTSVRLASSAIDASDSQFPSLVQAETHKEGIKSPVSFHRNVAKLISLRKHSNVGLES